MDKSYEFLRRLIPEIPDMNTKRYLFGRDKDPYEIKLYENKLGKMDDAILEFLKKNPEVFKERNTTSSR